MTTTNSSKLFNLQHEVVTEIKIFYLASTWKFRVTKILRTAGWCFWSYSNKYFVWIMQTKSFLPFQVLILSEKIRHTLFLSCICLPNCFCHFLSCLCLSLSRLFWVLVNTCILACACCRLSLSFLSLFCKITRRPVVHIFYCIGLFCFFKLIFC